jgi:regulator of replication initiation timing
MDLAIELVKENDKIKQQALNDLKEFKKQSLQTQAKKGEQLTAMIPAIKEAFTMMRDDNYELVVENDILKEKIGDVDEEWLSISKNKILEKCGDDHKNKVLIERMKKQQAKIKKSLK